MKLRALYLFCSSLCIVQGFSQVPAGIRKYQRSDLEHIHPVASSNLFLSSLSSSKSNHEEKLLSSPAPTPVENVIILKDANAVGKE